MASAPRWPRDVGSRKSGPTPLATTLQKILSQTGVSRRGGSQRIFDAWNEAVGPELARRAIPLGFQRGELRIQVDSSARLQELRGFSGEGHRAAANQILGEPAIRKIAFKLGGR